MNQHELTQGVQIYYLETLCVPDSTNSNDDHMFSTDSPPIQPETTILSTQIDNLKPDLENQDQPIDSSPNTPYPSEDTPLNTLAQAENSLTHAQTPINNPITLTAPPGGNPLTLTQPRFKDFPKKTKSPRLKVSKKTRNSHTNTPKTYLSSSIMNSSLRFRESKFR